MDNCIAAALRELEADRADDAAARERFRKLGERAQAMWKDVSDRYEQAGHPRHSAEAMAAQDVKAAFKREAGEARHSFITKMGELRRIEAEFEKNPNQNAARLAEKAHFLQLGLYKAVLGRLNRYYEENHRTWTGALTNPDRVRNVIRELMDEPTGDQVASGFAKGVRDQIEYMRLKLNELGANIGKLDAYGVKHNHDADKITKMGFAKWSEAIDGRLNWRRIEDPMTGRPLQSEGGPKPAAAIRQRFLQEVYDNIVFGRESRDPDYNSPRGMNIARANSKERVLHFNGADDWMAYHQDFGIGSPHQVITSQLFSMTRDYAHMHVFGRSPSLGIDYYEALQLNRARKSGDAAAVGAIRDSAKHAKRMMNIMRGLQGRQGDTGRAKVGRFLATTRMVLNAAHLDRAIFANLSDANSLNMASIANNLRGSDNLISRQLGLAQMMDRDDLLRAMHVMDGHTDAAGVMERWSHDTEPAAWAERLSFMSMKAQGLINWTDRARRNYREAEWRNLAVDAGKPFSEIDPVLQRRLSEWGITPAEWDALRNPDFMFKGSRGATFLVPEYWHAAARDVIDPKLADDILLKVNAMIAEGTEQAVPSNSPWARAVLGDGGDALPGTLQFEMMKSAMAYKSFPLAFMRGQYRALMAMPDRPTRWQYGAFVLASTTVAGAVSLQLADLAYGRDPQPMDNVSFVGRAMARGGGLGVLGDLIALGGGGSYGQGYADYFGGPIVSLAQEVAGLASSAGTGAVQLLTGEELDTKFAQKAGRFAKRNVPMMDTPLAGPFFRLFWDNLTIMLDPDAADAIQKASQRREKRTGNMEWWPVLSPTPARAPDPTSLSRLLQP